MIDLVRAILLEYWDKFSEVENRMVTRTKEFSEFPESPKRTKLPELPNFQNF